MIALWLALAAAHPLAPSVLTLAQTPDGLVATWREPIVQPTGERLTPALPCPPAAEPVIQLDEAALETRWPLSCSTLDGLQAGADGLSSGRNALVQWEGRTALLHADQPRVSLDAATRPGLTAALRSGIEHLLVGADHVLFLMGLVLLLPARRLVAPVTSFTAGHALSLAAVGLGWIALPTGLVEVGIALTLVWLAAELATGARSWIHRNPVVLCALFGLVHGLGFAGAWREAGLHQAGLLVGLLGFNLGVELAQLALVGLGALILTRTGPPQDRTRTALAWLGGILAATWVFERLAGWLL